MHLIESAIPLFCPLCSRSAPLLSCDIFKLSVHFRIVDIVTTPSPRSSGSDAVSELGAPHGVRIYLPPALFAYLVERAGHEGESLSSLIINLLYKEYDSKHH